MIIRSCKIIKTLLEMNKAVYIIILILFVFASHTKAQKFDVSQAKPLFQSKELLKLRLESKFNSVFSVVDDSTYFPAKISFEDNSGLNRTIAIDIRTRGKARRDKEICKFPPLRLKFTNEGTTNSVFDGQQAIKLVTHCQKAAVSEQNIILEFLIYRTFNILTDSSFRVRPAIINYVYTDQKRDSIQKFAFFIERDKHLAERLHGIELESVKIHPLRHHVFHSCLMDMFQYMIGNLDYSSYELHNIILITDSTNRLPPIAVPYDFDLCGLVLPYYAVPHPMFKVSSVTERLYRGFKKEPEIVNRTIEIFNNKKDEIYQLFNKFELLDNKEKKRVLRYLDKFYLIINNDRLVKVEFIDNARVPHD